MACSDCNNTVTSGCCGNPCGAGPGNTAACESLPSQIENFTIQFFGTVVKTECDGKVTWSLPCSLDVGLPNNPRGVDEGLACYFLRLFTDGIIGLTGPPGAPGEPGLNGNNAYTVTLSSFTQPSLVNPHIQVNTPFNPSILTGTYVFISTSGWYLIDDADPSGVLFLTLARSLPGASGTITAGKLVVPSGFPGTSVTGPQGPQGPAGAQGTPGASFTATNGFYFATVGTDFPLDITYQAVTFVNSSPAILLPAIGTYAISVVATVLGMAGVATTDIIKLKLRNTTDNADVPGSEMKLSNFVVDQLGQIVISVGVTTSSLNNTVALFGECTTAGKVNVVALNTTVAFVRLA